MLFRSRGAFEHMAKLREGAVIALLTPKILKPFQVSQFPDPLSTINAENTTTAFGQHTSPHDKHPRGDARVGGVYFRHRICKGPWNLSGD